MEAVEALERLGGIGAHAHVVPLCSRRSLRRAVDEGTVLRASRGRYSLPTAARALREAARVHGIVSHLGAAAHWGWEVKAQPEVPHVSVLRNRKLDARRVAGLRVHWTTWQEGDLRGVVTGPVRTVLDCARDLPFDEALAVADSALRHQDVAREELVDAAARLKGPGSARARRVAAYADGRAANPFESVLRAIAIGAGLVVVAQLEINIGDFTVHPDVCDAERGIALEADSWGHHGEDREDFERDCARYNALVIAGWLVLRFTWQQVMHSPAYVRWTIEQLPGGPGTPGRAQGTATPTIAA